MVSGKYERFRQDVYAGKVIVAKRPLIDVNKTPIYSKLEIAVHQLERAIKLYLDEKYYISTITLAGASEEILGKIIESAGGETDLSNFTNACVGFSILNGEEILKKKNLMI